MSARSSRGRVTHWLFALVPLALAASLLPLAPAVAGSAGKGPAQVVEANIKFPLRFPADPTYSSGSPTGSRPPERST